MSEELEPPEPIKQFENFTTSFQYEVEYTNPPSNTEYVDINFLKFIDANLNIEIVSNNVNVAKEIVEIDVGGEEGPPDLRDFFVFTISGAFGEELAVQDSFIVREGNNVRELNSFQELPDFSKPNTYMISYAPDSRHSVYVEYVFISNTDPANTIVTSAQEFELVPDRHTARIQQIRLTIDVRVAQEKEETIKKIQSLLNEAKNVPGV